MSIQSVVQGLFEGKDISNRVLRLIYGAGGIGAALMMLGGYAGIMWDLTYWYGYIASLAGGLGLIAAALFMYEKGKMEIPANPVNVAIPTIWGYRIPVILSEGIVFKLNFFPFYIDYILVLSGKRDIDWVFTGVRCAASPTDANPTARKTGGTVSVPVSLSIAPHIDKAESVKKFLDLGDMEGAIRNLNQIVGQSVQDTAIKYDWETFIGLNDALCVMLLVRISCVDFRQLPVGDDGLVKSEYLKSTFHHKDYEKLEGVQDPATYLFPKGGASTDDPTTAQRKRQEIAVFLRIASESSVADIIDLGIDIHRLNVPIIKPEGALAKSAEEFAAEAKQEEAEMADTNADIKSARLMVQASKDNGDNPPLTMAQALELRRISKGRATEHIYRGFENIGGAVAAAAQAFKK